MTQFKKRGKRKNKEDQPNYENNHSYNPMVSKYIKTELKWSYFEWISWLFDHSSTYFSIITSAAEYD